jgi:hypothetical protein
MVSSPETEILTQASCHNVEGLESGADVYRGRALCYPYSEIRPHGQHTLGMSLYGHIPCVPIRGLFHPASPPLCPAPPAGDRWLHEIKFDGLRLQLHKTGRDVHLFSKNGYDYTQRFPAIAAACRRFIRAPAFSTASSSLATRRSVRTFAPWMTAAPPGTIFALGCSTFCTFRPLPLEQRRQRLARLMARAANNPLRHSESFDDPIALLNAAARQELEGIVSKCRDSLFRSGPSRDWVKVKTAVWRDANRERWRLFENADVQSRR